MFRLIRLPALTIMVLVIALAFPVLGSETTGKVKSVDTDKNQLIFTDKALKEWTFHLSDSGKVYINDKEMKLADLKSDDEATVTYEKKDDRMLVSEIRVVRK
jgi:Cu/Ag efflux protein CusF